jgi:hypothetical protein
MKRKLISPTLKRLSISPKALLCTMTFTMVALLSACQSTSTTTTRNQPVSVEPSPTQSIGELLQQNEDVRQQRLQAQQQILNYAKAEKDYQALLGKFKTGEAALEDYDDIIRVYPLTAAYNPYGGIEVAKKEIAFEAMDQKNWPGCLEATNDIIETNFTSLTGHFGAMVCHYEMGNRELGEYHNAILDGFIDAIWRSGDGRTAASAFYITSTTDLYAFVQLNGFIATGQSLVYHEQRPIDAIDIQNANTQEELTWYFDVTAQFRRGFIDDLEAKQ